jgi:hypothetical protein
MNESKLDILVHITLGLLHDLRLVVTRSDLGRLSVTAICWS